MTSFTTTLLVELYGSVSYYGRKWDYGLDECCYLVIGVEHISLIVGVCLELEFG